jgi:hypothetical protein
MSSSAVRMRVLRRRRRQGRIPLRLEVDEVRLAGALIASKRLTPDETLRRGLVERELSRLIEDFVERWPLK